MAHSLEKRKERMRSPLGARLLKHRNAMQLRQREVAERIGRTQAYVSLIEHGKVKPSLDTARRLTELYRVSLDELVGA